MSLYLLQVSQDIHPTVKDTFPLSRVQLMDEISGVVLMTLLIPENRAVSHLQSH